MDPQLKQFHRQYLQQVTNLTYPPPKLLAHSDIQQQIYRYFFDESVDAFLPPLEYQRKILKRLVAVILKEAEDEDDEVSDELMAHMGYLSALPKQSEVEATQMPRVLSYFLPDLPTPESTTSTFDDTAETSNDPSPIERVLIWESPQLLAAGSNVGLRTWEACLRLAYYLCTSPVRLTLKGANVFELGAGTGLLSLICSMCLEAGHVIATDGLMHVVNGIKDNISINEQQLSLRNLGHRMPLAKAFDWADLSDLNDVLSLDGKELSIDYVLGADITYHPELLDPLASLLFKLKTRFPECRTLISVTVRNENTLKLWRQACHVHGLAIREINENEDRWRCPQYWLQTGLFHEQAFPTVLMDITRAMKE